MLDRIKRAIKKVERRVEGNEAYLDKLNESLAIVASDVEALKAEALAANKKE